MINFEEELKKFHPSLEVEDAEEAIYNQDLTAGSLLIEIGGHGNNLNEALYAGQLAAKGLAAALLGGA